MTTNDNGEVFKRYPAVRSLTRMSNVRYERLLRILKLFRQGNSVQEIAAETGLVKEKVYQEMYHLKNLGLLPQDFKNPGVSKWSKTNIVEKLRKEAEK